MTKYEVQKIGKKFAVCEFAEYNDVIVQTFDKEKPARELVSKLQNGSGFNGFTPPFFATRKK
jgi:hypothetical protein